MYFFCRNRCGRGAFVSVDSHHRAFRYRIHGAGKLPLCTWEGRFVHGDENRHLHRGPCVGMEIVVAVELLRGVYDERIRPMLVLFLVVEELWARQSSASTAIKQCLHSCVLSSSALPSPSLPSSSITHHGSCSHQVHRQGSSEEESRLCQAHVLGRNSYLAEDH